MKKMKIAYNILFTPTENRSILFLPSKPLLYTSIFVPTSKKSLCRTPNIKVKNSSISKSSVWKFRYKISEMIIVHILHSNCPPPAAIHARSLFCHSPTALSIMQDVNIYHFWYFVLEFSDRTLWNRPTAVLFIKTGCFVEHNACYLQRFM